MRARSLRIYSRSGTHSNYVDFPPPFPPGVGWGGFFGGCFCLQVPSSVIPTGPILELLMLRFLPPAKPGSYLRKLFFADFISQSLSKTTPLSLSLSQSH